MTILQSSAIPCKLIGAGRASRILPSSRTALSAYKTANEVFGFVDSRKLFERGFPMLRPVIVFAAAVVPGASAIIDGSKLPETESIAKHLQPIVYSQTRIPEGYLVESSGPDYDESSRPSERHGRELVPPASRQRTISDLLLPFIAWSPQDLHCKFASNGAFLENHLYEIFALDLRRHRTLDRARSLPKRKRNRFLPSFGSESFWLPGNPTTPADAVC